MQLSKNNLIGISGKIGSGKDLAGQILQYYLSVDRPTFKEFIYRHIENGHAIVNPKFRIKKFADTIKDTVCLWLGCTREQLEDREFKEKELGEEWRVKQTSYVLTPRKILQLLGTDAGRKIIHPNIWVNTMFANYSKFDTHTDQVVGGFIPKSKWIITDVRFQNEVEAIKKRGGVVIRIERDWSLRTPYKDLKDLSANGTTECIAKYLHASETALDSYSDFDIVINNNKSIEELYEQIRRNCE